MSDDKHDSSNPLGIVERPFVDSKQIESFLPIGQHGQHDNSELTETPGISSQITRGDASTLRCTLTMALDLASDTGDDAILQAVASARTAQVRLRIELNTLLAMHEREIGACNRNLDALVGRDRIGVAINREALKHHTQAVEHLRKLLEFAS